MAKSRIARQGHGRATNRYARALHSMDIHSGAAASQRNEAICCGKAKERIGMSLLGKAK